MVADNQCGTAETSYAPPSLRIGRPGEATRYGLLVIEAMSVPASTAGTTIGEFLGSYYHIDNRNLLPTRLRFGVRAAVAPMPTAAAMESFGHCPA